MVKQMTKEGRKHFVCEECGFSYAERVLAEKCQDWCKKHSSCNLEIIKHAIGAK